MKKIAIAAGAGIVAVIAAIFIYFNFIRADAPEEFSLTEATEESTDDGADADSDAEVEAEAEAEASADDPVTEELVLDGSWAVATGSEAGYRVVEDLGSVQNFEAVGRTSTITGSIDIEGTSITAGSFEVDIASIVSDDERRDGHFTGDVMNAAEFPTATLVMTAPIDLGSAPADGTVVEATATADLTLRDQTNRVNFPVQAQILDGQIEVVGSIDVLFSDYGIANPSNPFVTVRDEGKVEVRLLLAKS